MMKALSGIKQLRIEISKFQKEARSVSVVKLEKQDSIMDDLLGIASNKMQQSCFGCIQEYLQALLNFIQLTAGSSASIRDQFAQQDMAR